MREIKKRDFTYTIPSNHSINQNRPVHPPYFVKPQALDYARELSYPKCTQNPVTGEPQMESIQIKEDTIKAINGDTTDIHEKVMSCVGRLPLLRMAGIPIRAPVGGGFIDEKTGRPVLYLSDGRHRFTYLAIAGEQEIPVYGDFSEAFCETGLARKATPLEDQKLLDNYNMLRPLSHQLEESLRKEALKHSPQR